METNQCEATNVRGERCGKRAVRGRFCLVHAGAQNMVELGRRGGQVSPQARLREAVDDEIRGQARDVIKRGLAGDSSVTKMQLDAARSLFSYRAGSPPQRDLRLGE
jgi:hypothetical protein